MKNILTVAVIMLCIQVQAQEKQADFNRIADELIATDNDEDEADLEARYENLTLLLSNPLDLNKADADDLRQLYFLTEHQIQQLLQYRDEQGAFLSIYELQAVPDLQPDVIALLAPLVKVVANESMINKSLAKRMLSKGNSYVIMRWEKTLEEKAGFSDSLESRSRYAGSDQKMFMRFRSSIPYDYSFGFTLEKDAGETVQWDPGKRKFAGDYSSAHLQLINKGRLRNFIVGDFQAQFGQGLVIGGAFGLGKGSETITTIRKTNLGFVPHASAGESGFYRGAAASYLLHKNIRLSAFISDIKRDASISEEESGKTITSFPYGGFHRNENEIARERNASETVVGAVAQYNRKQFDAGVIFQKIEFQYDVQRTANAYNQLAFSGRENLNASLFYNYAFHNFCFFGELANSYQAGSAMVSGVIASLTPAFDVSLLYRNYSPKFYSFYGNAFAENSQPQNERGIYWGVKYRWSKRWTLSSYVDLFRFPWLAFRRYAPSQGYEWLTGFPFSHREKFLFSHRHARRRKREITQKRQRNIS